MVFLPAIGYIECPPRELEGVLRPVTSAAPRRASADTHVLQLAEQLFFFSLSLSFSA